MKDKDKIPVCIKCKYFVDYDHCESENNVYKTPNYVNGKYDIHYFFTPSDKNKGGICISYKYKFKLRNLFKRIWR